MVINTAKAEAVFDTAGATRTDTMQSLVVPADWVGDDVETYIGFISADGKEVSNSFYSGAVTVE